MCIFKDKERVHTLFCFFMSAGIVLVMIAAVYFRAGIYFDTNDDRFLSEILSGVYGEHPEPHTIYMNYLLSLPLTALYKNYNKNTMAWTYASDFSYGDVYYHFEQYFKTVQE